MHGATANLHPKYKTRQFCITIIYHKIYAQRLHIAGPLGDEPTSDSERSIHFMMPSRSESMIAELLVGFMSQNNGISSISQHISTRL